MTLQRPIQCGLTLAFWGICAVSWGQGLLVNIEPGERIRLPRPVPPPTRVVQHEYQLKQIDVRARLTDQVARVQVGQTFVNRGKTTIQAAFVFPLPYDGAIDELTLLVDGKEFPAKLLDRDEARRIYESIVRQNQDPALLEWIGTGMFQTSVFPIPPGAERQVTLRYTQLCRQYQGATDFLFPLSTARYTSKPVEQVHIEVSIESANPIKNVYSPTHQVDIQREGRRATARYTGSNLTPAADFRLLFDVGDDPVSARVLSYRPTGRSGDDGDGYFLLMAAPSIRHDASPAKKTVVIAVDRSGSMSGKKIEQAKGAVRHVLNNLRKGDLFNIVAYDSRVESFRPELQRYHNETRQQALGFVDGLYAGGSTNISGALATALGQLTDPKQPSYVLFLTDGLPTTGETNEMKIVAESRRQNDVRARIITFGVGYDVNSRLLDRLARDNFGQTEYVRPDEDIEDRVSRLYQRIESPVLSDVTIEWQFDRPVSESAGVNRVYPREVFDLFAGEQLVVVGRYRRAGAAKVVVSGKLAGQTQRHEFTAELVKQSRDDSQAFIERLWAMRRVGEIIDELDLQGRNDELITELVALAKRHGILTPYTSFLAEEDGARNGTLVRSQAESRLRQLVEAEGRSGFAQREAKATLRESAMAAPAADSAAMYYDALADRTVQVTSMQQVGAKTFYRIGREWVDSAVDEQQAAQARSVRQFSDEYFQLAQQHGRALSQYLAIDGPLVVSIDGQILRIEPAE